MCDQFLNHKTHIRKFYGLVPRLGLMGLIVASRRRAVFSVKSTLISSYKISEPKAKHLSFILVNAFIGVLHSHLLDDSPILTDAEVRADVIQMTINLIKIEQQNAPS